MQQAKCARRAAARSSIATLAMTVILALTSMGPTAALSASQGTQQTSSRQIRPGEAVQAAFRPGATEADASPFHDYELELGERETVRIEMISPDPGTAPSPGSSEETGGFDTYLELRRPGSDEILRSDDDSGEGLNSRMSFVAPATGKYIIRARPYSGLGEETASYLLRVSPLPTAPEPREFTGTRVEGRLGSASPEGEGNDPVRYDAYRLAGVAGERIQLVMESNVDSPGLEVTNDAGVIIGSAIGFDENRVRLISVLPTSGTYLVRAQSPTDQDAQYSVELLRATAPASRTIEPITVGARLNRQLDLRSDSENNNDGSGTINFFYRLFSLEVEQNHPVTVMLRSTDFAPIIEAGAASVLGFQPTLTDSVIDTTPGRIVVDPFLSGTVLLRVRSPGLEAGSFELSVTDGIVLPEGSGL